MSESAPQLISCDEAGFTGPQLLDDNQPLFAYAAIDLSTAEAIHTIKALRDGKKPKAKNRASDIADIIG